jgi:uncharacterized protein YcbX
MWIDAIWRYPVKSMRGEHLDAAEFGPLGIPGDRVAYVVDEHGETVSARTRPALLGLSGGLRNDGAPTVDGHPWDTDTAAALVRQAADSGARLVRARSSERFDILPLLVATDGAVQAAGVDVRRLRPNIVIGGVEGLAEREWEGRFIHAGDAVIGLATLRGRCIVTTYDPDTGEQDIDVLLSINRRFGGSLALNAWVAQPGRIRVGDPVHLLDSFADPDVPLFGRFVEPARG